MIWYQFQFIWTIFIFWSFVVICATFEAVALCPFRADMGLKIEIHQDLATVHLATVTFRYRYKNFQTFLPKK